MRSQRNDTKEDKPLAGAMLFGSLFSLNLIAGNDKTAKSRKRAPLAIPSELYVLEKPDSKSEILQW
jgi:hypothetical protein